MGFLELPDGPALIAYAIGVEVEGDVVRSMRSGLRNVSSLLSLSERGLTRMRLQSRFPLPSSVHAVGKPFSREAHMPTFSESHSSMSARCASRTITTTAAASTWIGLLGAVGTSPLVSAGE